MTKIKNIKKFIRQRKETHPVESHSDSALDVATTHAEDLTKPTGEISFDTKATDTVDPKYAQAATQETADQLRENRSMDNKRLLTAEMMNRSKMPQYPGLERWILVEKMGDGAFSDVYRARDSKMEFGEVAIKVLRSFEMNGNQVALPLTFPILPFPMASGAGSSQQINSLSSKFNLHFGVNEVAKDSGCARTSLGYTRLTSW
jgi:hypothetical protein